MYQSVLMRPRDLDEDIYDMTNPRGKKYDKEFHKKLLDNHKTVKKFIESDIWKEFKEIYNKKYPKLNAKD